MHGYSFCTEEGFCDEENMTIVTPEFNGTLFEYIWPETAVGSAAILPCILGPAMVEGMARRFCNSMGEWDEPSLDECVEGRVNTHTVSPVGPCV